MAVAQANGEAANTHHFLLGVETLVCIAYRGEGANMQNKYLAWKHGGNTRRIHVCVG